MRQRRGPPLAPETTHVESVFAATGPHQTPQTHALVDRLTLQGTVTTPPGVMELDALDQYAISEHGIGAFTHRWGHANRLRATCGTDQVRNAPCSDDTREVIVTSNVVTEINDDPGSDALDEHTFALDGLQASVAAARSAAGVTADGSTVHLVTVDASDDSAGASIQDTADIMQGLGVDERAIPNGIGVFSHVAD